MRLQLILLPMSILFRRNTILLRAYAFATTPPVTSTRNFGVTTNIFSSTQDKTSSIPSTTVETFLPIAGHQQTKSFGGLTYVETPEELQRVIFVLGGPGSGKVSDI